MSNDASNVIALKLHQPSATVARVSHYMVPETCNIEMEIFDADNNNM